MSKKKFPDFLKAKGFYISLLTGICAICVICIVYVNMLTGNEKDKKIDLNGTDKQSELNVVDNNNKTIENVEGNVADVPVDLTGDAEVEDIQPTTGKTVVKEKDIVSPKKNSVNVQSAPEKKLSFNEEKGLLWPLEGNIIINYSMDSVTYFQTLDQYKCNPAIIISAEVGDEVLNSARGIVTDITYNEETGNTITVSVGNDYKVIYGQLDNIAVKKDQTIEEGTRIGTIAEPTKYYVKEGPNLYYEVIQEEETVNPMLLLR